MLLKWQSVMPMDLSRPGLAEFSWSMYRLSSRARGFRTLPTTVAALFGMARGHPSRLFWSRLSMSQQPARFPDSRCSRVFVSSYTGQPLPPVPGTILVACISDQVGTSRLRSRVLSLCSARRPLLDCGQVGLAEHFKEAGHRKAVGLDVILGKK